MVGMHGKHGQVALNTATEPRGRSLTSLSLGDLPSWSRRRPNMAVSRVYALLFVLFHAAYYAGINDYCHYLGFLGMVMFLAAVIGMTRTNTIRRGYIHGPWGNYFRREDCYNVASVARVREARMIAGQRHATAAPPQDGECIDIVRVGHGRAAGREQRHIFRTSRRHPAGHDHGVERRHGLARAVEEVRHSAYRRLRWAGNGTNYHIDQLRLTEALSSGTATHSPPLSTIPIDSHLGLSTLRGPRLPHIDLRREPKKLRSRQRRGRTMAPPVVDAVIPWRGKGRGHRLAGAAARRSYMARATKAIVAALMLWADCRVGEATNPGPDGSHDEARGMDITSGNVTGWGTALQWLDTCTATVLCIQEHKQRELEDVAAASTQAINKGWKSLWAPAVTAPTDQDGASAGVAVLARKHVGMKEPPGGHIVVIGHVVGALIEAGATGGLVVYSV